MAKGVKKGSAQARSFAERQNQEKMLWTIKTIAYEQQYMIDAVSLTLNECFGFGEERLKRFHDAFDKKYAEIRELEQNDTQDNEYAKAKVEDALKAAWGRYYEPYEHRYDFKLITPDGKEIKL